MEAENRYQPPKAEVLIAAGAPQHASIEPLNPWVSILTKPRTTIQYVIDTDPRRRVLLLAMLGGVAQALNASDELWAPVTFGIVAIVGPFYGLIFLYLAAALLRWTGAWLGGRAAQEQLRAALAWGNVPLISGAQPD